MKKKIRSYLVFASTGYRIWGLVVIPALLFAATYFIFSDIAEITSVGVYTGGSVILFFEIISDYPLYAWGDPAHDGHLSCNVIFFRVRCRDPWYAWRHP